jgi:hypothetical protein
MFVIVALVAVWLAYSANWIRQRREFVRDKQADASTSIFVRESPVVAPGLLWVFGEDGVEVLLLQTPTESDFAEGRRLFPEAQIATVPEWAWKSEYLQRADRQQ